MNVTEAGLDPKSSQANKSDTRAPQMRIYTWLAPEAEDEPQPESLDCDTPTLDRRSEQFVVNKNGEILTATSSGIEMLKQGCALLCNDSRLMPIDTVYSGHWIAQLKLTAIEGKARLVRVSQLSHAPHVVLSPGGDAHTILVYIESSNLCPRWLVDSYAKAYRLTKTETQVLWMLSQGLQPKKVALEKGTSEATVRSQIKSVLQKTGETAIWKQLIRLGRLNQTTDLARS